MLLAPAQSVQAYSDGVLPDAEAQFVSLTNQLRAQQGLPTLQVNAELTNKTRAWSQTMSGAGTISHSNLPTGVTQQWKKLGENVGMGPDVTAIHNALVASPSHLKNLIDPGFRYIGVGVVSTNGVLFISEVFMELASQPAPSTPAPAAGTPTSRVEVAPASANAAPAPAPAPDPAPLVAPLRVTLTLEQLRDLEN